VRAIEKQYPLDLFMDTAKVAGLAFRAANHYHGLSFTFDVKTHASNMSKIQESVDALVDTLAKSANDKAKRAFGLLPRTDKRPRDVSDVDEKEKKKKKKKKIRMSE